MKRSSNDILKNLMKNVENELNLDVDNSVLFDRESTNTKENMNIHTENTEEKINIINYKSDEKNEYIELDGKVDYSNLNISKFDISEYCINENFSKTAETEAENLSKEGIDKEIEGREDLRGLKIFTIDGKNSKDLDDAISISKRKNENFLLGVHIADVSHYIREYSQIDKEAKARATSVYLNDRVIPMLPREISNGVCSLNQGEDRLALSVFMEIDKFGSTVNHWICESVIKSSLRTNYQDVSDFLENDDEPLKEHFGEFTEDLKLSYELSKILRKMRDERGALSFDTPSTRVILNENRVPIEIIKEERRSANIIIEEFMLTANETIANHFDNKEIPFIYRVLDNPHKRTVKTMDKFVTVESLGLKNIEIDDIEPKEIKRILDNMNDEGMSEIIKAYIISAERQARYSSVCSGHYTLAIDSYCHFTSPIRRYPDLQIHRIIKDSINGRMNTARKQHYGSFVDDIASISTVKARNADIAERECENRYRKIYKYLNKNQKNSSKK